MHTTPPHDRSGHGVPSTPLVRWGTWALVVALCALTFVLKRSVHAERLHLGHGDIAQYFILAENVYEGRGMFLDYVPVWLNVPDELRVSGAGYWMPLPAWIGSFGMWLTGEADFQSALFGAALLTSLLPALIFLLAREVYARRDIALLAAALAAVFPTYLDRGGQITTHGPAGMLACLVLLGLLKSKRDWRWLALVGIAAGLSHTNRSDGMFWVPVALAVYWWWNRGALRWKPVATLLATYLLALSPLLIASWTTQGSLLPQGQWRAALLTSYPELYSLPSRLTWDHFAGRGFEVIAAEKWKTLSTNLIATPTSVAAGDGLRYFKELGGVTPYAWIALCWIGFVCLPRRLSGIVALRFGFDLALYSLVFSHTGMTSFHPTQYLIYPALLIGAARLVIWVADRVRGAEPVGVARAAIAGVGVVALCGWLGVESYAQSKTRVDKRAVTEAKIHAYHEKLSAEILETDALREEPLFVAQTIVHTFHGNTGRKVASLPFHAEADEIRDLAGRLGLRHLLLERGATRSPAWPELAEILNGPGFHELGAKRIDGREVVVWRIDPLR